MSKGQLFLTYNRYGFVVTWSGGEYAEIRADIGTMREILERPPIEVLNLFDYELGAPRIPVTLAALAKEVDAWYTEAELDDEDRDDPGPRCVACGDPIEYCSGHGEIGDPVGFEILRAHDDGDHRRCDPVACEEREG